MRRWLIVLLILFTTGGFLFIVSVVEPRNSSAGVSNLPKPPAMNEVIAGHIQSHLESAREIIALSNSGRRGRSFLIFRQQDGSLGRYQVNENGILFYISEGQFDSVGGPVSTFDTMCYGPEGTAGPTVNPPDAQWITVRFVLSKSNGSSEEFETTTALSSRSMLEMR